jgi:hypothetical protein
MFSLQILPDIDTNRLAQQLQSRSFDLIAGTLRLDYVNLLTWKVARTKNPKTNTSAPYKTCETPQPDHGLFIFETAKRGNGSQLSPAAIAGAVHVYSLTATQTCRRLRHPIRRR